MNPLNKVALDLLKLSIKNKNIQKRTADSIRKKINNPKTQKVTIENLITGLSKSAKGDYKFSLRKMRDSNNKETLKVINNVRGKIINDKIGFNKKYANKRITNINTAKKFVTDIVVDNYNNDLLTKKKSDALKRKIMSSRLSSLKNYVNGLYGQSIDHNNFFINREKSKVAEDRMKQINEVAIKLLKIKDWENIIKNAKNIKKHKDNVGLKDLKNINDLINYQKSVTKANDKRTRLIQDDFDKLDDKHNFMKTQYAFRGLTEGTSFIPKMYYGNNINVDRNDMDYFIDYQKYELKHEIRKLLLNVMKKLKMIKFQVVHKVEYVKVVNGKTIRRISYPQSDIHELIDTSLKSFDNVIEKIFNEIILDIGEYGWEIDTVLFSYVNYSKYNPLRVGSYIQLPKSILLKKACINVQNKDNECFKWAILSALHTPKKNADRPKQYEQFTKDYNWDGIIFPFKYSESDLVKFQNNNKININLFVIYDDDNSIKMKDLQECKNEVQITPLYLSPFKYYDKEVDLLIFNDNDKIRLDEDNNPDMPINKELKIKIESVNSHIVWIKDFSRLITSQISKDEHKLFYCKRCLHGYTKKKLLDDHKPHCSKHEVSRSILPEDGKKKFFKNFGNKIELPFIVYADFESIQVKKQVDQEDKTKKVAVHEISGYCYKVICSITEIDVEFGGLDDVDQQAAIMKLTEHEVLYRGEGAGKKFITDMKNLEVELWKIMDKYKDIYVMSNEEKKSQKESTSCYLCGCGIGEVDEEEVDESKKIKPKVIEHCHITGRYRGAACGRCNTQAAVRFIPVVFHNLRGYDSHLIFKQLGNEFNKIKVIPTNKEKYLSFDLGRLKFIDSYQFMAASLDKLTSSLFSKGLGKNKFYNMIEKFGDKVDLLLRKGVYFYDYANSFKVFNEKNIPTREQFYNSLEKKDISLDDYNHVKKVWKKFDIKNKGDYHDLYLRTDVLLLADIYENFRKTFLNSYGLDPARYITLPSYAFDCLLKMTGQSLDLISNEDMYLFLEDHKRGGICQIPNKYAKANNKYMKDYDENTKSSYIIDLDANNLYGWAMSQYLPIGNLVMMQNIEIFTEDFIKNISDVNKKGYILEVDLEYPKELHNLHNSYPLAPESKIITKDMISPYTKNLSEKLNIKPSKVAKLITSLSDKKKYKLHYRNLKLYLQLGLKLVKVHRVLAFDQKPWMKPYIDFNTDKRKQATTDFEKDLYKLMNNAVFGKTMENVRKRIDFEAVNNEARFQRLVNCPRLKNVTIFNETLVGVERYKTKVVLDKPIYVGSSILDLSKVLMYDFHYNIMKKKYGDNIMLLGTDTDSLKYCIETEDLYADMHEMSEYFDFSEYPKDHFCYDETNKKVIGKFKDETKSKIIYEFIGPAPKVYSQKTILNDENLEYEDDIPKYKKKDKGVKSCVIKDELTHEDFKNTVFNGTQKEVEFKSLRSMKHEMYTLEQIKIGLSSYDDKQYMLNPIQSLSYGHFLIKEVDELYK